MCEFYFSKNSKNIEDYRCFYNPATGYITGEELKEIKNRGDEDAKKKWLYFYPVDKEAVGIPQKQEIFYREGLIYLADWLLEKERKKS